LVVEALSYGKILKYFLVFLPQPGQTGRRRREVSGMTISTVSAVTPSVQVFKHN
jgi:hypothetical protein